MRPVNAFPIDPQTESEKKMRMHGQAVCSRRELLAWSGTAGIGLASFGGASMLSKCLHSAEPRDGKSGVIHGIADAEIRAGVESAVVKNLLAAATEVYYPGHFTISADGQAYGNDTTWPGLDSWQMAGAYLLLGRTRLVLDYFDFVRASQRKDGNIPFAIFSGATQPGGCLRGLKQPDDVFTYKPPKRDGLPPSSQVSRAWIGLFKHWHPKDPLGALGPVCYILTATEIYDSAGSLPWLRERLPSLEAAAKYLLTMKAANGLIGGAGFYMELPARYDWDGVTQCYVIRAFRELARMYGAAGEAASRSHWSTCADRLTEVFVSLFWRKDHFGEYIHPQRGLVDLHGLSDVNWAAVAFGIAVGKNLELLWPRLLKESGFWLGDMPTQNVSRPLAYQKWEYDEPLPVAATPLNDVAAMGRVWYLEALACQRMKAEDRLRESVRKVCRAANVDGYWRERYHPRSNGTVAPAGAEKYCEYAAVLVRVVLGNRDAFR
jgi:hypothetical protein